MAEDRLKFSKFGFFCKKTRDLWDNGPSISKLNEIASKKAR